MKLTCRQLERKPEIQFKEYQGCFSHFSGQRLQLGSEGSDTERQRSRSLLLSMFTNNFCSHEWTGGLLTNDTFRPPSIG